jgi:hypothetical protein
LQVPFTFRPSGADIDDFDVLSARSDYTARHVGEIIPNRFELVT